MSLVTAEAARGMSGAFIALTTVTTGLRFASRRWQQVKLGPDDWTILAAWIVFIAMNVCTLLETHWRYFGNWISSLVTADFPTTFKVLLTMDVAGCISEGLTRISALLFFRRIFCVSGRSHKLRFTIHSGMVLLVLWIITYTTLPLLQCGGNLAVIESAQHRKPAQYCRDMFAIAVFESYAVTDVIMELAVICLPIPFVFRLQTTLKRRLAILLVFSTAMLSLGAGVARLAITYSIFEAAKSGQNLTAQQGSDATTTIAVLWVMSAGAAIVAINLPSLYWMVVKVKPEKIFYGIRSTFSLSSLRKRAEESSRTTRDESPASRTQITGIAQTTTFGTNSDHPTDLEANYFEKQ